MSRTRARAESLAKELKKSKIQIYDAWQDLIESAEVDVISLATPPTVRLEPLVMAFEHGCHVLVEKPFSVGLNNARAMVTAAQQASTVTAMCFNWRYAPGCQVALREIQDGNIGKIFDVRMEWRLSGLDGNFFKQRPWIMDFTIGDGILAEGLSHEFDRTRFLSACEFKKVVSRLVEKPVPLEPEVTLDGGDCKILAVLTDNVLGDFHMTLTPGLPGYSMIFIGEKGTLKVAHETARRQCLDDAAEVALDVPVKDRLPEGVDINQHTWNRLISDFVFAIRNADIKHSSVPHLPKLEDGLRTQEVVAAARLSEDKGSWVEFDKL